jgi:hypothetical protein
MRNDINKSLNTTYGIGHGCHLSLTNISTLKKNLPSIPGNCHLAATPHTVKRYAKCSLLLKNDYLQKRYGKK